MKVGDFVYFRNAAGHVLPEMGKIVGDRDEANRFLVKWPQCREPQHWGDAWLVDAEAHDADRGVGTGAGASPPAEPAAGKKHDAEKPPLDLLDATALLEVGRVLEFGAKKYAPNNWRAGISRERLIAAALRHTLAAASGKRNDPESHLSHLAHAMCCLMFALHFEVKGTEVPDTRFKKP